MTPIQSQLKKSEEEFREKFGRFYHYESLDGSIRQFDFEPAKGIVLASDEVESFLLSAQLELLAVAREEIEKLPADFCNDGEYTDTEMVECLSGVIKTREAKILSLLSPEETEEK